MRDIKNKLTSGKNTKNIQTRKGKSFGYQVLGFGAGGGPVTFIVATGGTITTVDTDYKVHTFTGPGTFEVTQAGSGDNEGVGYLIVGGAGAGGSGSQGGGGGAGGYREATTGGYTASPLATPTLVPVSVQTYPIVIGGGGAKGSPGPEDNTTQGGNSGVASSALGLTSAGGGRGTSGATPTRGPGESGGSGGGNNSGNTPIHAGNTPPVSPPQGFPGGNGPAGSPSGFGAGGGGAGNSRAQPWVGDDGGTSSITGSAVILATGGGGGKNSGPGVPSNQGPRGGGAGGSSNIAGNSGATGNTDGGDSGTNLGAGGGGGGRQNSVQSRAGGNGGAGVVHIRYKFQ